MRALIGASVVVGLAANLAHGWITTLGPPQIQGRAVVAASNGDAVVAGDRVVARFAAADGAEVWRYEFAGNDFTGFGVAVDPAGDVVAGGGSHFAVVKLVGATGAEVWRYTAPDFGQVYAVVADGNGDVIAAGTSFVSPGTDFLVVKLAGASGAELWRDQTNGSSVSPYRYGSAHALALVPGGDVIAAGTMENATTGADLTVVRLAGATGAELWRAGLSSPDVVTGSADRADAVGVDAAGDVVAAGRLFNLGPDPDPVVVKLAGGTGAELWYTVFDTPVRFDLFDESAYAMGLDAAGNVVVAATLENVGTSSDFTVAKLAGVTGAEVWRREVNGTDDPDVLQVDAANAVAVDPSGDVVAAGFTTHQQTGQQLTVMKLAGADGSEIWRRDVNGRRGGDELDAAAALALDAEGNALVTGLLNVGTSGAPAVAIVRLADAVPGVSLVVRDVLANPAAKRVVFSVRSGPEPLVASAGGLADPRNGGATLELFNPGTGETASFPLPAAYWSALGTPPGYAGYKYVDAAQAAGPCTKVTINGPGRTNIQGPFVRVRAQCGGSGIGFSLDEPAQGGLGVRLTTGLASTVRVCAVFGGTVVQDTSTGSGGTGVFRARDAPAPGLGLCP